MQSITKATTVCIWFLISDISQTLAFEGDCKTSQEFSLCFCQGAKSCKIDGIKGKKQGCRVVFEFEEGCEKDIVLKLGSHTVLLKKGNDTVSRKTIFVQK